MSFKSGALNFGNMSSHIEPCSFNIMKSNSDKSEKRTVKPDVRLPLLQDMFRTLESPCTITSGASSSPVYIDEERKSDDSFHSFESEDSVTSVASSVLSSTSDELTQVSDISIDLPTSSHTIQQSSEASTGAVPQNSDSSSPSVVEEEPHRPLRKKRKIFSCENCPICGVTVRLQHMKEHYKYEITKLDALKKKPAKPRKEVVSPLYQKLEEVKANRVKRCQGSKDTKDVGVNTCLVCHPNPINDAMSVCSRAVLHFTQCENVVFDSVDSVVDVTESDESFEEYSIGEEERIRAVSLLESLATMPFDRIQNAEEDVVVVIDSDDDAVAFGPSQFSEHDLVPCQSTLNDENRVALREAVLSSSEKSSPRSPPFSSSEKSSPRSPPKRGVQPPDKENDALGGIFEVPERYFVPTVDTSKIQERNSTSSESIVIAALKSKIKELEEQVQNSAAKCNICLGDYKEPLVSVSCWHVSCKDCWMKTLGEKKLCPQCTKITLPTNLRRIYM